ncbi:MAG: hypothetical protein KIT72_06740 [Polyangiaceae bacterium]|nr:hypothetical protein [Polyangiaceae bacterium]MCW5790100.1 hypothetical protein [Polyangiaceae bacterium]
MDDEVEVRCDCGKVRGLVARLTRAQVNHLACYCEDCRAFLRFLEREDLLDDHGGTTIVQLSPYTVRFEQGASELCCMRLSPKGMIRWYAGCCQTPMGNTLSAGITFAGLTASTLQLSPEERQARLGPALKGNLQGAQNGPPPDEHPTSFARLIAKVIGRMVKWKVLSLVVDRGKASPYFDASGAPRATPKVLTLEERRALLARDQG